MNIKYYRNMARTHLKEWGWKDYEIDFLFNNSPQLFQPPPQPTITFIDDYNPPIQSTLYGCLRCFEPRCQHNQEYCSKCQKETV